MALQFQCSKCKQLISADEQHLGKVIGCPKCGTNLKVPDAPSDSSPQRAADSLIGKQIAHYRIESLLGQGGMGKVYKARNVRLDKSCAIKILPPEFARQDEGSIQRFIREARSAANVEHPNVLPVHNVGKVGDDYFIEMSYADGGDLDGLLAKRGRMDVREAARITRDIASALDAAHEQGIIHRDIKPSNVMFTKRGRALVADFGLAKMGQATTALTMSGAIVGTPLYMSPEQCSGKELDQRSDIYSLGVMFYQMLAGKPPYGAPDVVGLIGQHIHAPVPDIRNDVEGVPEQMASIIQKMMAKNPDERYQSCREVVSDLDAVLTPRPVAAAVKKKSRAGLYAAAIAIVALMAVGITVGVMKSEREKGITPAGPLAVAAKRVPSPAPAPVTEKPVATPTSALPEAKPTEPAVPKETARPEPLPSPELRKPEPAKVEAPAPPPKPKVESPKPDLVAYYHDIKPVNDLIDKMRYDEADSRAGLLKSKYPDLIEAKIKNIGAMQALCNRCIERVNTGAIKVGMKDVSRRYAFAGPIKEADNTGLTAMIKKKWADLKKEEVANFLRKAADPNRPEDAIGIAAYLMEGNKPDFNAAMVLLGRAAKNGEDVSGYLAYLETLKKASQQYAEAKRREKALEAEEIASREGAKTAEDKAEQKPSAPSAVKSYDDVYVTTAATGEKIPHPLSRKTYKIVYQGKRIEAPEGMVFVPPGPFLMGRDDNNNKNTGYIQKEVYLDGYFIDKFEVTNAQYMEFVKATKHPMPLYWRHTGGRIPDGCESHPVAYVSWEDAKAYCDWCGKRLPTEAEWEKAAGWNLKKGEKREYPWGNDYDPHKANHCYQLGCRCGGDGNTHNLWWNKWAKSDEGRRIMALGGNTAPVGKFAADVSFFGCFDMGANVQEWCSDWYDAQYYKKGPDKNPTGPTEQEAPLISEESIKEKACRVRRGGHWCYLPRSLRAAYRSRYVPSYWLHYTGFRCAADYPWKPQDVKPPPSAPPPEKAVPKAEGPAAKAEPSSYDGVYVTTAATGEKIPHPLSRKTYTVVYKGKKINAPESMVFVPPGPFLMGEGDIPPMGPRREVYLDAYFIGKYEVTNAQYMEFVKATGYLVPTYWANGKIPNGKENHPVVQVAWEDAKAYCDWCGKRLPTEAEWEKAAGWDMDAKKPREYPWGDTYDPKRANHCYQLGCRCNGNGDVHSPWVREQQKTPTWRRISDLGGNTAPVGEFKGDMSFFGCFDMGGNVREWVNDWHQADYYRTGPRKNPPGPSVAGATLKGVKPCRVVRGGYYYGFRLMSRAVYRYYQEADGRAALTGFRCAADYPWKPEAKK